jgi:hypothetical protein
VAAVATETASALRHALADLLGLLLGDTAIGDRLLQSALEALAVHGAQGRAHLAPALAELTGERVEAGSAVPPAPTRSSRAIASGVGPLGRAPGLLGADAVQLGGEAAGVLRFALLRVCTEHRAERAGALGGYGGPSDEHGSDGQRDHCGSANHASSLGRRPALDRLARIVEGHLERRLKTSSRVPERPARCERGPRRDGGAKLRDGRQALVPRHREIGAGIGRAICRQLGIPPIPKRREALLRSACAAGAGGVANARRPPRRRHGARR